MKKLIVFLVILLTSSKTFSQTDTSKDSLICLPKSLVTKTVQDLTKCDGERQEMVLLKENLQLLLIWRMKTLNIQWCLVMIMKIMIQILSKNRRILEIYWKTSNKMLTISRKVSTRILTQILGIME